MQIDIPPLRKRAAAGSDGRVLEKEVIRAVSELLATHGSVRFAVRQNGGAMLDGEGRPSIWFYKIVRSRSVDRLTISDFWGFLVDGTPFAIEAKRPGWKRNENDIHENKQAQFLLMIRSCGGRAGFADGVEDARAIIEGTI